MGIRRRARELALQALFYMDIRQVSPEEGVPLFCRNYPPPKKSLPFFLELISGVAHHREQIDAVIEQHSSNWKISRMSGVDRNILRIAVYELLKKDDVPPKVAINEAIDVGKRFGTDDSGAFINGILDSIREAMAAGRIQVRLERPPAIDVDLPMDAGHAADPSAPTTGPAFLKVRGRRGVVKRSPARPADDDPLSGE